MSRKTFPSNDGIYQVVGGISSTYYMNDDDAKRYRYLKPAYPKDPHNVIKVSDCWIVDKEGNINPGTAESPVPFQVEVLGRKVSKLF